MISVILVFRIIMAYNKKDGWSGNILMTDLILPDDLDLMWQEKATLEAKKVEAR